MIKAGSVFNSNSRTWFLFMHFDMLLGTRCEIRYDGGQNQIIFINSRSLIF